MELDRERGDAGDQREECEKREPSRDAGPPAAMLGEGNGATDGKGEDKRRPQLVEDQAGEAIGKKIGEITDKATDQDGAGDQR